MKKFIFSLAVLFSAGSLFAQTPAQKKTVADVAKFETETIDLGKVKQDAPPTATFTVTNISGQPLLIDQANPTCGCTIGNYTKEPIAPGKTGTITATYNAKNLGHFEKHMTVRFAGVDEMKTITIKGDVLSPEEYAKLSPGATAPVKAESVAPASTTADQRVPAKVEKKQVKKVTKTTTTAPAKG